MGRVLTIDGRPSAFDRFICFGNLMNLVADHVDHADHTPLDAASFEVRLLRDRYANAVAMLDESLRSKNEQAIESVRARFIAAFPAVSPVE